MHESHACWLYLGSEVMDTERLWWWEVSGGLGPAEAAGLVSDRESEEDTEGASGGEEPAVVEQVEDEEGRVVVEDREAELEEAEQDSSVLQELWKDCRENGNNNEIAKLFCVLLWVPALF